MEIRPAAEADIPEIVALLKLSLGESLMPKSEQFWRWKHVGNPFGQSPVLLAVDSDRLVGVRAFMRWAWHTSDRRIEAVRAVDTATHPDFQGKGIFSKLTKALLAQCGEMNIQMVFNTPNEKSKPGYLKMGWEEAGRVPVTIDMRSPVRIAMGLLSKQGPAPAKSAAGNLSLLEDPSLPALLERHARKMKDWITTPVTQPYLLWRYRDSPVAAYFADGVGANHVEGLVIYRLKDSRLGREMRITNFFFTESKAASQLKDIVRTRAREHGVHYITADGFFGKQVLGGLAFKRSIGPVVTIRRVTQEPLDAFRTFAAWRPDVGDLELF